MDICRTWCIGTTIEVGLTRPRALQNINQQLLNQYVAIKRALEVLALDTFRIDNFSLKPDGRFNIGNALTAP